MSQGVKCPVCKHRLTIKPIKTWKFRFYDVKRYECNSCNSKFNIYESPTSTFTIPKAKK